MRTILAINITRHSLRTPPRPSRHMQPSSSHKTITLPCTTVRPPTSQHHTRCLSPLFAITRGNHHRNSEKLRMGGFLSWRTMPVSTFYLSTQTTTPRPTPNSKSTKSDPVKIPRSRDHLHYRPLRARRTAHAVILALVASVSFNVHGCRYVLLRTSTTQASRGSRTSSWGQMGQSTCI